MNRQTKSPRPIFDSAEHLQNPFGMSPVRLPEHLEDMTPFSIQKDYECALRFLYSYNAVLTTYRTYRRDLDRLMNWAWLVHHKSILDLKLEDIRAFIDFCTKPPKSWVSDKTIRRYTGQAVRTPNTQWRPFLTKKGSDRFVLGEATVKAMFRNLSTFYNYLTTEGYTATNPVAAVKQKSSYIQQTQGHRPVRRISNIQWDYVLEVAETLAAENNVHERSLFIVKAMTYMYLRISEFVSDKNHTPTMGDFHKDMDHNWWFSVVGKGNKSRNIAVSDEMMETLKRYRLALGLAELPLLNEKTPLIPNLRGGAPIKSTRQIRTLVKSMFEKAYQKMKEDGLEADAMELRQATAHWLRHTGISEDVKIRPREHVRDDAGHYSMQTTDRYIDSDNRERHASAKRKGIKL